MPEMPEELIPRIETRTLWYQVQYSRASQDANDALRGRHALAGAAAARASLVALTSATTLNALGQWDQRRPAPRMTSLFGTASRDRRRLMRFLVETLEPSNLVMLAGLSERTGVRHVADRYELAGYLAAGVPIHPRALTRFVRSYPNLSYRAAYNLACYYAGRIAADAEYADDALRRLQQALSNAPRDEQAGLARWAGDDPSLAPLEEAVTTQFRHLVEYYADPAIPHEHHPRAERQATREPRRRPLAEE